MSDPVMGREEAGVINLQAIGRAVPAIVPCWGEPVVLGELFS